MFPFIFIVALIAGCFATFFGIREAMDPAAAAAVYEANWLYQSLGAASIAYIKMGVGALLLLVGMIGLGRFYARLKR